MSNATKVSDLLLKTHNSFLKVGAYFAGKGDLLMVEEILKQRPAWIHTRGSHGRSMLWEAVNHNRKDMVAYLLEKGADIEAPGCHFSEHLVEISPYCLALRKGNSEMAEFLLTKGAEDDIYSAAYRGDISTVKKIVQNKPEQIKLIHPKAYDKTWASLMHYAVAGGNLEIVRLAGEKGAHVKAYSRWLLTFALWEDAWDIMELLVEFGADPQVLTISSVLPETVADRLKALGFTHDINYPNEMGWPPIVYACRGDNGEHPEEVLALLKAGANIHARNLKGSTALHTAAKAGFNRVVELLIKNGAEVDAEDNFGNTPLFMGISSGIKKQERLLKSIACLLKHGANVHHVSKQGKTVEILLKKAKNKDYLLPLLNQYLDL